MFTQTESEVSFSSCVKTGTNKACRIRARPGHRLTFRTAPPREVFMTRIAWHAYLCQEQLTQKVSDSPRSVKLFCH